MRLGRVIAPNEPQHVGADRVQNAGLSGRLEYTLSWIWLWIFCLIARRNCGGMAVFSSVWGNVGASIQLISVDIANCTIQALTRQ